MQGRELARRFGEHSCSSIHSLRAAALPGTRRAGRPVVVCAAQCVRHWHHHWQQRPEPHTAAAAAASQGTLKEVQAERSERARLGAAPNYQRTLP